MPLRLVASFMLLTTVMLFSSGCSTFSRKPKKKPEMVARQPAFVGTITLVNHESQFVLIDNGLLPIPPAGLVLKSFTNGTESAELVTSAARRRPFTIADIRNGTPQNGDRVFVATSSVLPAKAASQPGAPTGTSNTPPPSAPDFLPQVQLSPTP